MTSTNSKSITKERLKQAVISAVSAQTTTSANINPSEVAKRVTSDPDIAPALQPIPMLQSQVFQGLSIIAVAQFLEFTGLVKSLVIVAGWFGQEWSPDEVGVVLTTMLTVGGLLYAWYGRKNTTRPIA